MFTPYLTLGILLAIGLVIRILSESLNSPENRGERGERLVAKRLRNGLPEKTFLETKVNIC